MVSYLETIKQTIGLQPTIYLCPFSILFIILFLNLRIGYCWLFHGFITHKPADKIHTLHKPGLSVQSIANSQLFGTMKHISYILFMSDGVSIFIREVCRRHRRVKSELNIVLPASSWKA